MTVSVFVAGLAGLGASLLSLLGTSHLKRRLAIPQLGPRILRELQILVSGSETQDFLRIYRQLMANVLKFAGRQLALATLSIGPVIALYIVTSNVCDALTTWRSSYLDVRPPQPCLVRTSDSQYMLAAGQHCFPLASGQDSQAQILIEGKLVSTIYTRRKQAVTASNYQRLGFICVGFDILNSEESVVQRATTIISRPAADDANIFWPWLSDAELTFLCVASLGSLVIAPVARRRK